MGDQIVLTTDPLVNNLFLGSADITQFCMNTTEWIGQQQAFQQTAIQLAYFCLVVGAVIGFISGYYYSKRKGSYGDV